MDRPDDRDVVRSLHNPTVKHVRSLDRRKGRDLERAFVVEGPRAIADAVAAGFQPEVVLVRHRDEALIPEALPIETPLRRVSPSVFATLTDTVTPQGILAVFPIPEVAVDPAGGGPALVLVIDGVRDPGNVGTLLRAAAGSGATRVVVTRGTADPYGPKAVRAAVGAHFRVPIQVLAIDGIGAALAVPQRVLCDAAGETAYDRVDWKLPSAVIVGSEAHGPSPASKALATRTVAVPLLRGVESLNAAVAGAVVLFEAARQRRWAGEVGAG